MDGRLRSWTSIGKGRSWCAMCGAVPGQVDLQKRFTLTLMWKRHVALIHLEGDARTHADNQ